MSRIGKLPIIIPANVTVNTEKGVVTVKGPKGELKMNIPVYCKYAIDNGKIMVEIEGDNRDNLSGLARTLLDNMVKGVVEEWKRILELSGTGYRATITGSDLNLALGFSHPVIIKPPQGIFFEVKENKITVRGTDKAIVGEVASKIRRLKPADPYKAKGLKYEGEVIIHKAGKAAKAGAPVAGK
jgi:large subunit ribosomal protein L6